MQHARQLVVEHVFHERTLAAAADAGHRSESAEWDADVDVFKIVVPGSTNQTGRRKGKGSEWIFSPSFFLFFLPPSVFESLPSIRLFLGTPIAFLFDR